MLNTLRPKVAIADYGIGNLFSVRHACEQVGLEASITTSSKEILAASAVILPGVGAFGDAMAALERLGLESALRDFAVSGRPILGICLGMQLLMTQSHEFGRHRGLNIVEGEVLRLKEFTGEERRLKVPHVGWNRIYGHSLENVPGHHAATWNGSILEGLSQGEFMYFVHSYYPLPVDSRVVLSSTPYGPIGFCSSLRFGNVFGCQFHPERSGPRGLRIYQNFARLIRDSKWGQQNVGTTRSEIRTA